MPSTPGTPSATSQNNAIFVDWGAPSTGGSAITHDDLNDGSTTVNEGTTSIRTVGFGQSGSERTFRWLAVEPGELLGRGDVAAMVM